MEMDPQDLPADAGLLRQIVLQLRILAEADHHSCLISITIPG